MTLNPRRQERIGFDGQEAETSFQPGQAPYILLVIRQIREAATLLSEGNPTKECKLVENIVSLSEVLEYYVQKDETRATNKKQTPSNYSRIIRKKKRKRKRLHYYQLKSEKIAEMYEDLCNKTEMSLPNHLVPRHQREETKEEYEVRVNQAQQKLMEEIEILRLKSDTYGEKIKMIDKEIDNMIIVKYEKHPIKKEHLRNQWKEKCKKEEMKSSQIWQDKEANMRSNIDRVIIPNSMEQESNEEGHHVTKKTLKNMRMENRKYLLTIL